MDAICNPRFLFYVCPTNKIQKSINLIIKMKTGKVKFYNETKGYGFITKENSNEEVFVHATALVDKSRPLQSNDFVQFEEEMGKKGLNAINVAVVSGN